VSARLASRAPDGADAADVGAPVPPE
jgi:hypothetical protein